MVRESVCLHIGQAGIQIGHQLWEQLGKIFAQISIFDSEHLNTALQNHWKNRKYFRMRPFSRPTLHKATLHVNSRRFRNHLLWFWGAVFLDTESAVIDALNTSSVRHLISPHFCVSGTNDASGNYANAKFTSALPLIDEAIKKVRQNIEHCNHLTGKGSTLSISLQYRLRNTPFRKHLRVTDSFLSLRLVNGITTFIFI